MSTIPQSDALAEICADTRAELHRRSAATPLPILRAQAEAAPPPRGFASALGQTAQTGFALIAEIKKASPSGGLIRPEFDPPALAQSYQRAGAACLSILTDFPYFQGEPAHLRAARAATALPVIRKDFMLDPWQIYESRVMGADCILLILACLDDPTAADLEATAHALGMDVLVEVHDAAELDRALKLKTPLLGINNRNLKTLKTDITTTLTLARHAPADRFLIGESGLRSHDDLRLLAGAGVRAFLVGESLMRQPDVEAATRALLFG